MLHVSGSAHNYSEAGHGSSDCRWAKPVPPQLSRAGVSPGASPATPISFAGKISHPSVNRRAGLSPSSTARHPLQKSPRQGAVQSRRPVVAGRTRFAGQDAISACARDPIYAHRPVPTLAVASCDPAKMNPDWVSVSEN